MGTITTSEIKKIIQDSMTDYLSTTGKYIIEGIIRDTLKETVIVNKHDNGYNPLVEAQQVIGGNQMYLHPTINNGSNPYPTPQNTLYTQQTIQPSVDNKPKHRFTSILEQTMRNSGDLSNFGDNRDNMA